MRTSRLIATGILGGGNLRYRSLLNGLVAYWDFNEDSDGSAPVTRADKLGLHNLTDNGLIPSATGVNYFGAAASTLQASSQYFSCAGDGALNPGDADFTIYWRGVLKAVNVSSALIAKYVTAKRSYMLDFDITASRFRLLVSGDGTAFSTQPADLLGVPQINTLYTIIAWHDAAANTINIRVNGQANSKAHTTGIHSNDAEFRIGARGISAFNYASAYHDEAGAWNRVLTEAEMLALEAGIVYPFEPVTRDYLTATNAFGSWWSLPRAQYLDGKTHFSAIGDDGITLVGYYDHANNTVHQRTFASLGADDHNTPAILVPSDKPPIVGYSKHNADFVTRIRRGASAAGYWGDLAAEQTVTFPEATSYVQIYREPGTDNLLMLTRGGTYNWYAVRSTDYGATWGAPFKLLAFGGTNQGYMTCAQNGAVLNVAVYGHPENSTFDDLFFCQINLTSGAISDRDGTVIGNLDGTGLPLDVQTGLELIYAPANGYGIRLFDVSNDLTNPQIAIGEWTTDTDTMYYVLRWTGSEWAKEPLTTAGVVFGYNAPTHYNGGVCFTNPASNTVYLARESGGTWSMEKWTRGASVWSLAATIKTDAAQKIVRPFTVIGGVSFPAMYHANVVYGADYTSYYGDLYGAP